MTSPRDGRDERRAEVTGVRGSTDPRVLKWGCGMRVPWSGCQGVFGLLNQKPASFWDCSPQVLKGRSSRVWRNRFRRTFSLTSDLGVALFGDSP